jgi:hypothetical protein
MVTMEQLNLARKLMHEAQDTNIAVLMMHLNGSDKATRIHRKTNRRAVRRADALSDLYAKIERLEEEFKETS